MGPVTPMEPELEKIDIIRTRFKVGYDEAAQELAASGGDLVNALVTLERKNGTRPDLIALGMEMIDEAQRVAAGSPIKRLKIKYGDRTVTDTPVTLTAAAALAVGVAAVLISKLVIELVKDEEEAVR